MDQAEIIYRLRCVAGYIAAIDGAPQSVKLLRAAADEIERLAKVERRAGEAAETKGA